MSTTTTYDHLAAIAAATTAAELQLGAVQDRLNDEYDEAIEMAKDYARHLASGGDPTQYDTPGREGVTHGLALVARNAVFDAWNETRERGSVTRPWDHSYGQYDCITSWLVQEALLDSLGTPVPYAELRSVRGEPSPQDVGAAAWQLQVLTGGKLRVRKTKVGGQVAWLVREQRDGDDEADAYLRDGYYKRGDADADREALRDALGSPFRSSRVFEYPEEVV